MLLREPAGGGVVEKTWQKYVEAASGVTEVTRRRAEQVVRSLVKQGEIAADNMERAVEELLQRSEQNRKAVSTLVKAESERAVTRFGLARKRDLERLENQVERLEAQLRDLRGAKKATKKTAKKSAAAKRAAKKSAAKKATRKRAKKASKKA
jgi:polyhydroxyalkanoate synthesis regulator phasin